LEHHSRQLEDTLVKTDDLKKKDCQDDLKKTVSCQDDSHDQYSLLSTVASSYVDVTVAASEKVYTDLQ